MIKKTLWGSALTLFLVSAAYGSYNYYSKPAFISKAESKLASFLQYTYGPGGCKAVSITHNSWQMTCNYDEGKSIFKYALYSPDQAPYKVANGFYLVALNDFARQSATEGLTRYLDIDIDNAS